ncbi:formaldehyde-activating enzyme [Hyphomicrobium facile]|uniref:Formaldehyde-activating enzyme n=1 Tax=Hyphomicrobium facile TaxID=51670 RepID=A0A1I7NDV7_9HYPH|nr:formaldehyde-activating enzyme [Hyphomicrobium facile]SFV32842.1 formaldehyde-activating enzyme [Hyphomicrobium facile]
MNNLLFRTGEATVLAAKGQYTDAMPEVVIGTIDGPVGQAFASMMGQSLGHTRFFVIRNLNQMVRPAAMMTSKVTIPNGAYVGLFGGVVQAATGDAIVDCLKEDILPKDKANELCMILTIWLDPRCADHAELDKRDLYRCNYEATKLAIARAMRCEPSVEELISNRDKVQHYALTGVFPPK